MDTPMSASSPRGCFVCVPLLYNTPNPPRQTATALILCHYISFYAGDLYNRRKDGGRREKPEKGWSKGKGVSLVFCCVVYRCVSLKHYKSWTSNETEFPISQITVYQSNWRERRATFTNGQTLQIYFAHSYLPTENNRTNVCRGTLVWVTILSSSRSRCWAVFPLKQTSECSGREAGSCWDAFRTADSASARRTRERSELSSREWNQETLKVGLKKKGETLRYEQRKQFQWCYRVFRCSSVNFPFPLHFTDTPFIAEGFKKELTSLFRPVPEVNK